MWSLIQLIWVLDNLIFMNINKKLSKKINNKCLKYYLIEEFDLKQLIKSCNHWLNHLTLKLVNIFNQGNLSC